jgi:hypothetical protein
VTIEVANSQSGHGYSIAGEGNAIQEGKHRDSTSTVGALINHMRGRATTAKVTLTPQAAKSTV